MIKLQVQPAPTAPPTGGVWDYVSASRLNLWLRCPLAFRLRYIDGVRTPTTPSLFLGKQVHRGLEQFYRHRQLGIRLNMDDVVRQTLDKRAGQLRKAMLARVRGVAIDDVGDYYDYQHDQEVTRAVARRQAVHADTLLAESELGRRVLQLRREKDELIDVVWLASSPREVKQLWTKVTELLGDDQTQLQHEALGIEAVDDQ